MNRRRMLELGAAAVLVLVLAALGLAYARYRAASDELSRLLDRAEWSRPEAETAYRLIHSGANIHPRQKDGWTVLMLGARSGYLPLVREALVRGLPVEERDWMGQTALFHAMASRDEACARELLRAGADVNARDSGGRTPLMWATEFRFIQGMRLLLARRADVNARNHKGFTALAYTEAQPPLLRLLYAHGAQGTPPPPTRQEKRPRHVQ